MPIRRKKAVAASVSFIPSPVPAVPAVEPILLAIPAAARALGCTVWAMRALLWDGKIPFIKIGRRFLVDPADLRAFIAREKLERAA